MLFLALRLCCFASCCTSRLFSGSSLLVSSLSGQYLLLLHDLLVPDLVQMPEVLLDGQDRVLASDVVRRLFGDHHLNGVRVPARARWDDGGVDHPQALQSTHPTTTQHHDTHQYIRAMNGSHRRRLWGQPGRVTSNN